jgi:hypothetical protein
MAAMAFVELVPGEWVQTLYSVVNNSIIKHCFSKSDLVFSNIINNLLTELVRSGQLSLDSILVLFPFVDQAVGVVQYKRKKNSSPVLSLSQ